MKDEDFYKMISGMMETREKERMLGNRKGKTMNLKVRRTEKLKTDLLHVGDVISFRLTTGEKEIGRAHV